MSPALLLLHLEPTIRISLDSDATQLLNRLMASKLQLNFRWPAKLLSIQTTPSVSILFVYLKNELASDKYFKIEE
jgi:hypothetical protein